MAQGGDDRVDRRPGARYRCCSWPLWTWGGRQGWANGMVVTPAEAIRPILGDSSDSYRRAAAATLSAAARGLRHRRRRRLPRRARRRLRPPVAGLRGAPRGGRQRRALGGRRAVPADRARARVGVRSPSPRWPCSSRSSSRPRSGSAPRRRPRMTSPPPSGPVGSAGSGRCSSRRRWPSIADGLKLAAPAALAGAVFGEWYGAERGLGVLLITVDARRAGRPAVGGRPALCRLWARRVRRLLAPAGAGDPPVRRIGRTQGAGSGAARAAARAMSPTSRARCSPSWSCSSGCGGRGSRSKDISPIVVPAPSARPRRPDRRAGRLPRRRRCPRC